MKLLIDTHIFLWMLASDPRISKAARAFLEDNRTYSIFLSDVSVWEVSIKYGRGRLLLPDIPEVFFPDRVRRTGYHHLPIDIRHVAKVHSLPNIHGDPFDRLLITQAKVEDMTIVSDDRIFSEYDVKSLTIKDIS